MINYRLWYKKSSTAIYTSHLDMNRAFTRAVRMAEIPIWYTEGFNPHPYLNFLLPLPLGQSCLSEPVDIRIEAEISAMDIKNRLNAVLPDGIEIIDVSDPVMKVNDIVKAEYEIKFIFDSDKEAEGFYSVTDSILNSGILEAEKKSKKGVNKVNLCDFIKNWKLSISLNSVNLIAVLSTGTQSNLNASLLTDTLMKESGADDAYCAIERTKILTEDNKEFR